VVRGCFGSVFETTSCRSLGHESDSGSQEWRAW